MKKQLWTLRDFEDMGLGIANVSYENKWIVLWLTSGTRLKFEGWKSHNEFSEKQIDKSERLVGAAA